MAISLIKLFSHLKSSFFLGMNCSFRLREMTIMREAYRILEMTVAMAPPRIPRAGKGPGPKIRI